MELFTLTVMTASENVIQQLYDDLRNEMAGLLHIHNGVNLSLTIGHNTTSIICTAVLPGFSLDESADEVYEQASKGLAQFVLQEWEAKLIHDLLIREYDYHNKEELLKLEQYCARLLNDTDGVPYGSNGASRRKMKIAEEFRKYLQENTFINLDGFIRFRLRQYTEELQELVEYALDEFQMDKQYQEFISLLKYFVYIQEAKIPVVHLMHVGENEFIILNEQMKPIDTAQAESVVLEMVDKDINYEDMIVSTLITVSPKHIFIHTRSADAQVVKTIQQIFEGRVKICDYCKICKPLLGEEKHVDPLMADK
ncbi:MAG TPA: putative sporulation protein YtxC [Bacilli bacterium]